MMSSGFISTGDIATKLILMFSFISGCIFCTCIITLQNFPSCFQNIARTLSYLDSMPRRIIYENSLKTTSINQAYVINSSEVHAETPKLRGEDVEMIIQNLGLSLDTKGKRSSLEGSIEIANMFDENEPSLDEVREAFAVFDENNDGFIDTEELKRVVSLIGLRGYSRKECERMIMAFDENGDGRIDFGEFMKLMANCFS